MSKKKAILRNEIEELLDSYNFEAIQIIGDGEEEPYEGCTRNLSVILNSEDFDVVVEKLDEEHPLCRKGHKTYRIAFDGWMGKSQIVIWDLDESED